MNYAESGKYNPEEIDLGVASPLDEDLIELFGTRQPSYEMVGQHQDELWKMCDRGQAIYIVGYKDQTPDEVFFMGVSGD